MKKAFTLAEIMIVLTVVGILGAVLLPSMFRTRPDEELLKFKNSNTNFASVIKQLVNSGDYYLIGDLGHLADGRLVTELDENSASTATSSKNLCINIGKLLKLPDSKINCKTTGYSTLFATLAKENGELGTIENDPDTLKANLDEYCLAAQESDNSLGVSAELILPDGSVWYQASPQASFATTDNVTGKRLFSDPTSTPNYPDANGKDANYKVFCIDVDGLDETPPFGYGVRADGRIVTGALVDSWLEKSSASVTKSAKDEKNNAASVSDANEECQDGQGCDNEIPFSAIP
ncbi:type II secretion system protein [bacterium]|nr:type II secretion system protein [bacterium]